jgi:hypothetical protein
MAVQLDALVGVDRLGAGCLRVGGPHLERDYRQRMFPRPVDAVSEANCRG